jgi:hypothetical protein
MTLATVLSRTYHGGAFDWASGGGFFLGEHRAFVAELSAWLRVLGGTS